MHILLVEPDAVLAQIYCRAFEHANLQVTWATHAQAALDAADNQTPDIVVLELQLTAHSGIEFLYEFRSYAEWQNIPVIVHTLVPIADVGSKTWLQEQLGVQDYQYKPNTSITQLLATMHAHIFIEQ